MECLESIWTFILAHPLPLVAALVNFVWIYLEYKASIWLWPVGIVLPIFYIVVSWQGRAYGNLVINVYYLITSIIGWVVWLRSKGAEETAELPITHTPRNTALYLLGVVAVLLWPASIVLSRYTDSVLPMADALATLLAFVGMILLARKWREHWLCWIVSNLLYALVFYVAEDAVTSIVMLVNFVVAILGYRHWGKLMKEQDHA